MNPKCIILINEVKPQRLHTVWFYLHEITEKGKEKTENEIENRLVVARHWEQEEILGGNRNVLYLAGGGYMTESIYKSS